MAGRIIVKTGGRVEVGSGSRINAGATPPSSYSEIILADSPTGYWKFDETSGTTAFDSSGNSQDLFIPETFLNGAPVIAEGGLAASFDGGPTSFSSISSTLPVIADGSTSFSLEIWVEISTVTVGTQYCISYPESSAGGSNGADIRVTSTDVHFDVVTSGGGLLFVTHSGAIPNNTPTHLVLTYDGVNIRGYFNGALETPVAQTTGASLADEEINIGRFGLNGTQNLFIGRCDEAAMYSTVLSDAQVLAHFNAGS